MKTNLKALVHHSNTRDTYYIYSPTLGDTIRSGFDTKMDAEKAVVACGGSVIEEKDLHDPEGTSGLSDNLRHLAWWVENCDFECVRTSFDEIVYHEACIRKNEGDPTGSEMLTACAMSVATSVVLENLAKDLNHWFPSHEWTNLASWKLDQMLENGPVDVKCDLGTVHLEG